MHRVLALELFSETRLFVASPLNIGLHVCGCCSSFCEDNVKQSLEQIEILNDLGSPCSLRNGKQACSCLQLIGNQQVVNWSIDCFLFHFVCSWILMPGRCTKVLTY